MFFYIVFGMHVSKCQIRKALADTLKVNSLTLEGFGRHLIRVYVIKNYENRQIVTTFCNAHVEGVNSESSETLPPQKGF